MHPNARHLCQQGEQPSSTGGSLAKGIESKLVECLAGNKGLPGSGEAVVRDGDLTLMVLLAGRGIPDDDLALAGVKQQKRTDADRWLAGHRQPTQVAQKPAQILDLHARHPLEILHHRVRKHRRAF